MCVCTFNKHIDHHEPQLKATGGETKTVVLIFETVTQTMDSIDLYCITKREGVLHSVHAETRAVYLEYNVYHSTAVKMEY